jgi:hypothetical protein
MRTYSGPRSRPCGAGRSSSSDSEGSALTRFRRALATGNGAAAYAAAAELQRIELADALALTLLLAGDPELFDRACVRWTARFALEVRGVRMRQAHLALASLAAVRPGDTVGARSLAELCAAVGREDLASVLEDWAERQPT